MRLLGVLLATTFLSTILAQPARQPHASKLNRRIINGNHDDNVEGTENQDLSNVGSQSPQNPSLPPNAPPEMNIPPSLTDPSPSDLAPVHDTAPVLGRGLTAEQVREAFPIKKDKPYFNSRLWDDYLSEHPKDRPKDGESFNECIENWEALIHGSGDFDQRRMTYYEAKCRKAHGLEEELRKLQQESGSQGGPGNEWARATFRERFGEASKRKPKASDNQDDQLAEQQADPNSSSAINTVADVAGKVGLGIGGFMTAAKGLGQFIGGVSDRDYPFGAELQ